MKSCDTGTNNALSAMVLAVKMTTQNEAFLLWEKGMKTCVVWDVKKAMTKAVLTKKVRQRSV